MKRLFVLISFLPLIYLSPPVPGQPDTVPEFPEFGSDTDGGVNGKVIRVSNLNSEGPGSLREAVNTKGERLIVFEAGGVIDLNGNGLVVDHPNVTIAGQTAPSPGITIIRGGIGIKDTHNVVIRHLRVRPGDETGDVADAIGTVNAKDVHMDHCSLSWATDEVLSASGNRHKGPEDASHRITFSNNIIAEGLHDSIHGNPHSMGSLIHDFCTNIAVVGNFYGHNNQRNPRYKGHTTGIIANNIIYNPGRRAIRIDLMRGQYPLAGHSAKAGRVSVVGNVLQHGPDTIDKLPIIYGRNQAKVFERHNLVRDRSGGALTTTGGELTILEDPPVWPEGFREESPLRTTASVMHNVGARPWDRTATDRRILQTFRKGTGRIIDSQEEVGGYPDLDETERRLDVPEKKPSRMAEPV